jgi:DNA-binding IclR family transcriptional regulator
MSATEGYFIVRTVSLLELLADSPRTTSEIAELLLIHPRTARRMLARLVEEGYVERPPRPTFGYSLSPRFATLAARALLQRSTIELTSDRS